MLPELTHTWPLPPPDAPVTLGGLLAAVGIAGADTGALLAGALLAGALLAGALVTARDLDRRLRLTWLLVPLFWPLALPV